MDQLVGQHVLQGRVTLGLTSEDLARAIGVTTKDMEAFEAGSKRIGADLLFKLSKALNVPLAAFFRQRH